MAGIIYVWMLGYYSDETAKYVGSRTFSCGNKGNEMKKKEHCIDSTVTDCLDSKLPKR